MGEKITNSYSGNNTSGKQSNNRSHTDRPSCKDKFGITPYVEGLSKFIAECNTPMTIAIQGDWGSGKTSLMLMIEEEMKKKKIPLRCIWFNTWQYSQFGMIEHLPISLVELITKELDIKRDKEFKKLKGILRLLATVVVEKGAGSVTAASTKEILSPKTKGLKELKNQFKKCIEKACDKIVKENKKGDEGRIIIFVDDLDRLKPSHAIEVLEVLKNFLDVPRCVFVLAIDYNVVVKGVEDKYGKEEKGKSFFDKIIQLPFKMPVPHYNIRDFVKQEYHAISNETCEENEVELLTSIINNSVGSNPRSMKRLFNAFSLLLNIDNAEKADKDTKDKGNDKMLLFAVLCIQQHFEDLYLYLVQERENLEAKDLKKLAGKGKSLKEQEKGEEEKHEKSGVKKGKIKQEDLLNNKEVEQFMTDFNQLLFNSKGEDGEESRLEELQRILQRSSATSRKVQVDEKTEVNEITYRDFWGRALPKIKNETRMLYKRNYVLNRQFITSVIYGDIYVQIMLLKHSVVADLRIEYRDKDKNKKIYRMLEDRRDELEKVFYEKSGIMDEKLEWKILEENVLSKIELRLNKGGFADQDKWDSMTEDMIKCAKGFEEAFEMTLHEICRFLEGLPTYVT